MGDSSEFGAGGGHMGFIDDTVAGGGDGLGTGGAGGGNYGYESSDGWAASVFEDSYYEDPWTGQQTDSHGNYINSSGALINSDGQILVWANDEGQLVDSNGEVQVEADRYQEYLAYQQAQVDQSAEDSAFYDLGGNVNTTYKIDQDGNISRESIGGFEQSFLDGVDLGGQTAGSFTEGDIYALKAAQYESTGAGDFVPVEGKENLYIDADGSLKYSDEKSLTESAIDDDFSIVDLIGSIASYAVSLTNPIAGAVLGYAWDYQSADSEAEGVGGVFDDLVSSIFPAYQIANTAYDWINGDDKGTIGYELASNWFSTDLRESSGLNYNLYSGFDSGYSTQEYSDWNYPQYSDHSSAYIGAYDQPVYAPSQQWRYRAYNEPVQVVDTHRLFNWQREPIKVSPILGSEVEYMVGSDSIFSPASANPKVSYSRWNFQDYRTYEKLFGKGIELKDGSMLKIDNSSFVDAYMLGTDAIDSIYSGSIEKLNAIKQEIIDNPMSSLLPEDYVQYWTNYYAHGVFGDDAVDDIFALKDQQAIDAIDTEIARLQSDYSTFMETGEIPDQVLTDYVTQNTNRGLFGYLGDDAFIDVTQFDSYAALGDVPSFYSRALGGNEADLLTDTAAFSFEIPSHYGSDTGSVNAFVDSYQQSVNGALGLYESLLSNENATPEQVSAAYASYERKVSELEKAEQFRAEVEQYAIDNGLTQQYYNNEYAYLSSASNYYDWINDSRTSQPDETAPLIDQVTLSAPDYSSGFEHLEGFKSDNNLTDYEYSFEPLEAGMSEGIYDAFQSSREEAVEYDWTEFGKESSVQQDDAGWENFGSGQAENVSDEDLAWSSLATDNTQKSWGELQPT